MVAAIKGTAAGETFIDPSIGGTLLSHVAKTTTQHDTTITADLSERELEILKLLASGLTNTEIAARLFLSKGTVRNYISAILTKLNVEDRTQAAVLAVRHGLADSQ